MDQVDGLGEARDRTAVRRLDAVLLGITIALGGLTAFILLDPLLSFVLVDRSLDVAINSLVLLGSGSLAALTLARYRESGRVAGLFQSSAFLVVAWLAGIVTILVVLKVEFRFGLTLAQPEQLPLYVTAISRILAAALLVAGGLAAVGAIRSAPQVRRTLLVPIAVMTVLAIVAYAVREWLPDVIAQLPPLIGPEGIQALIEEPRVGGALAGQTALALLVQTVSCGLFIVGALLYRRSFARGGPVADGYLAVAMLIGAFAELHFYFYPGVYSGLVSSSAALRLAFFVVLLLGINAESRSDMRALRNAYAALDRLRRSEAERATLEERTRLARELHDGLAQDLWFAKLKHERLVPHVPDEQRGLAAEVTQALDQAIAEAKQAVATMRAAAEGELPLHELLARSVDEFGSRSGLRVDFSAADLPQSLPARSQAEVLRVLQEALTNIGKHADATVVRVSAEVEGDMLTLSVLDNGRGFRPAETPGDGMGLQGMRERARLMGGDLRIESEPSGGTGVYLAVPLRERVVAS
ncbi:MAG TPA: sensor histidine kinase [Candidatus Limnocylindria bacterium]|jgi:signal transduction histidine kinase|nr:sensor histidine kinase [Candidatus Limnocylindria bacterium]